LIVAELKRFLDTLNNDDLVIVARDSEGNSFSPLDVVERVYYRPETTYSGDCFAFEESDPLDGMEPAVVLWPIN